MFGRKKLKSSQGLLAANGRVIRGHQAREKVGASLKGSNATISLPADYGFSERVTLYRFLRENIPIISGAIWIWVRLCASPMEFHLKDGAKERNIALLKSQLDKLNRILSPNPYYKSGGLDRLCDLFFSSLFIDGAFAGNIELNESGKLAGFSPCDIRNLTFECEADQAGYPRWNIYRESEGGRELLDPATFIYIPLDDDAGDPRGKSILQSVGFVSRLEQKLLDDMQKTQEKAGYNRLHVLIKKPERRLGETEQSYIDRANSYFDDTVTLFSGIKPSDSAVTWDDIEIKTIGPASGTGTATHSWYLSHRALVEDICAGVHLDPFMLGYSYSSTQTWARFKFELVLREIISVQRQAGRFFEWLVNTHLALEGVDLKASVKFDNDRVNSVLEKYQAEREQSDRVIELFKAGLLSKDEAREKINERID
ncbi:MAG TPA: hypothetical protein DEO84_03545 [candidate division Zixibacteria bacterium]|nr:hypothetical protein [candidate division Zixibacteria bacterium]